MVKHSTALLEGLVGMIRGLANRRSGGVSVAEGTLAPSDIPMNVPFTFRNKQTITLSLT
jgi:hypothetical protein